MKSRVEKEREKECLQSERVSGRKGRGIEETTWHSQEVIPASIGAINLASARQNVLSHYL